MCWTAGLVETVLDRKSRASCPDGSCGNPTSGRREGAG